MLNVIDISSWQADLVPSRMATTDGIIVKATGGTGYVNGSFKGHMDAAIASGKLAGCYHYAQEQGYAGSAKAEADHFIEHFGPYVGKAIPYLDWEGDALNLKPAYAKAWLDRVYAKTGVKPGIYMSKSTCRAFDWSAVAKDYPLWVAQYPDYSETGWQADPWTDSSGYGAWKGYELFQYTSCGKVKGYSGHLDLDLYKGNAKSWKTRTEPGSALAKATAAAKAAVASSAAYQVVVNCAEVAAKIHQRMCDDDGFGYSWEERYGADVDKVTWVIEGRKYTLCRGDYDCSSSVITAWRMALQGTAYEGALDGASTTRDMRAVFMASGLFEVWDTATTEAVRGDVYLNDASHTAMCQDGGRDGVYGYDALSEFCWGDKGAYGNTRGDQSGYEAYVHAYYDYPWTCTLHYNGKANTTAKASSPSQTSKASSAKLAVDGDWGTLTTKELRRQLGLKVNGRRNAVLYSALRVKIGPKANPASNDGVLTPALVRHLQRKLGVKATGKVDARTVKALQRALNKGKVAKW